MFVTYLKWWHLEQAHVLKSAPLKSLSAGEVIIAPPQTTSRTLESRRHPVDADIHVHTALESTLASCSETVGRRGNNVQRKADAADELTDGHGA